MSEPSAPNQASQVSDPPAESATPAPRGSSQREPPPPPKPQFIQVGVKFPGVPVANTVSEERAGSGGKGC